MFNARYFRTFITLVETGSFTRTARRLEMTQPGVSQHLRKLEAYLGKPLLDRQARRFVLTESGRRVYDYALKLFAEHEQFRHALDDASLDRGECRLASAGSVGLKLYPFILDQQQLQPGLTVSYRFACNAEVIAELLRGQHDLGIVADAVRHPDLVCQAWHQEPLCLVVPADFSGAGLTDLIALGFIGYAEGDDPAAALLRANFSDFRAMSQLPRQGFTSEVSRVLEAVARGLGFTVVSRVVLEASTRQRELKVLALASPAYESLHLVMRAGEQVPRRYGRLLEGYREQRRLIHDGFNARPERHQT